MHLWDALYIIRHQSSQYYELSNKIFHFLRFAHLQAGLQRYFGGLDSQASATTLVVKHF
jgi:hypothetical protein